MSDKYENIEKVKRLDFDHLDMLVSERRLHEVNTELRKKIAAMEKSYEDLASNLALANKNARMFQQRWQLAERLSPRRQGPINLDDCGAPHLKEDI